MTDLTTIQRYLDNAAQPNSLRDLFCQMLNWGRPQGVGQRLAVGSPVDQTLMAQPVAQLGDLPVFQIDWLDSKAPTVMQRRAVYHRLAPIAFEHLLCYVTSDGQNVSFVWAHDRGGKRVELRTLPYEQDIPARTTIERLAALAFRLDEFDMPGQVSSTHVVERLNAAFDVESVTKEFFSTYRSAFDYVESTISGISDPHMRWLFTQKVFNRLMFIVFLERKGWLRYQGRKDYLRALWEAHQRERLHDPGANFYNDRLKLLFFVGLNTLHEVNVVNIKRNHVLDERIGSVPYLNGGLFEQEEDDTNDRIGVPDDALERALTDLFYRFHFTISESTPFDIEVAVDPEMLGKVFEELVTGRHESGSYYTPRPVVAFMCREGLKGYLHTRVSHESPEVIARFVDERGASDLHNPEAALEALKHVRVCDPACGSGAYLLGMLQELLALRTGLFAAHQIDATTTYQRKLEIIQNNIYGVDIDPFAVNIARLRLWLSLVVEYDNDEPPSLPNLDYKVETGDSLAAPDPSGGLEPDMFRQQQVADYFKLKEQYLRSHGSEKSALRTQVEAKQQEIAAWAHPQGGIKGFDWAVEFAEVFSNGGFDIVVANPPYVRKELIDKQKKLVLSKNFTDTTSGNSDLYVYFYERGLHLLRNGGMHIFICSNSWLDVEFGSILQRYLLETTHIQAIIDSAIERQFATADINTIISVIQKIHVDGTAETKFSMLNAPFAQAIANDDDQRTIIQTRQQLWEAGLDSTREYTLGKWGSTYLRSPDIYRTILGKHEQRFTRLHHLIHIRYGIKPGTVKFFYLTRDHIQKWGIESEYLKPIITSSKHLCGMHIYPDSFLFYCHTPMTELHGTAAFEYIKWGESQKYHTGSSVRAHRPCWYSLHGEPIDLLLLRFWDKRFWTPYARDVVYCSDNFFYGRNKRADSGVIAALLNTTWHYLQIEILGRTNQGQGVLNTYGLEYQSMQCISSSFVDCVALIEAFSVLEKRAVRSIFEEVKQPDRHALDAVLFDALGLTQGEQDAVYEALVRLVEMRLNKAESRKK